MRRTTISLPDDLTDLLRDEARRRSTSVSEVVRRIIAQSLLGSEAKPREIPFAGIIDDPEMVQSDQIEDFLEETWTDAIDRDRR
jgi:metal-responsive CopG/Arc/MetJ family transcriptional regulator